MDLCADQLLAHLPAACPEVVATDLETPFRRRFGRLPVVDRRNAAFNADRLLNRHLVLPRFLRRRAADADLFHIVDHSYAHLVHSLPPGRAGVYCHDLDAFRSLLEPEKDPRPWWFRRLASHILAGLQKAAVGFYSTASVREQIVRHGLLDPGKLVYAPYGVAAEFTLDRPDPAPRPPWLAGLAGRPWVLHVGSCIPRKRIDVLLDVVAAVRTKLPDLKLVKVGGEWMANHRGRIARHGLAGAITHVGGLTRMELAEVYRRAAIVLVPSEAEGFGLPVIEALACGAAVVASDIPALREAGGPAAAYAPVGDVGAWSDAVSKVLTDPAAAPPRAGRLAWAAQFSWAAHAETIARSYRRLL